jgi:hypothetical protein
VNVQLNDDTGVDWAMYVVTVATPVSDPIGPTVFVDGGGVATVSAPLPMVRTLQVGGSTESELRLATNGRINVSQNYLQLADGTLTVELSAASLFDAPLAVFGEAALAGSLAVALADGFAPGVGYEFQIIAASGGISGDFDNVLLPALPSHLGWKLVYAPTAALLQVVLPGDYNGDNVVDAADYVVWRKTFGLTGSGLAADGDGDGEIGSGDFDVWRAHFGQAAGGGAQARGSVPEPPAPAILLTGVMTALFLWRSFQIRRPAMDRQCPRS